jgi:putative addiction module component (TIGR02574 family)
MKMQSEEIENAALELAPKARLRLAHALVRSLDSVDPETIRELWIDEAERREAEMDEGAVRGVPGEEVLARIRAKYR